MIYRNQKINLHEIPCTHKDFYSPAIPESSTTKNNTARISKSMFFPLPSIAHFYTLDFIKIILLCIYNTV